MDLEITSLFILDPEWCLNIPWTLIIDGIYFRAHHHRASTVLVDATMEQWGFASKKHFGKGMWLCWEGSWVAAPAEGSVLWHQPCVTCLLWHQPHVTRCLLSKCIITVKGPKGKRAAICPFIGQKPITVWQKDLLSQWGIK